MLTATLISTFGLDGTVKALFFSSSGEHIKVGMEVTAHLKNKSIIKLIVKKIKKSNHKAGLYFMLFEGYDTKEKASVLSGAKLYVKREFAHRLEKDEVYTCDLIGLDVMYNAQKVARIIYIIEGGNVPFLEVMRNDGKHFIIPYQKHFLGDVDLVKGEIELLNLELLDL